MPPIGVRGSYATDKPIQDTVGDAMRYNEQMSFRYREEAEKKKAEIAKAKAEQDKALPTFDDTVSYTPDESDNAMRFDLANKLRKRIDEASNDVRKGKISQQDWNLINANAKATVDFINQGAANINTQAAKIAELASQGKLAKGSVDEALRLGGAYDNRRINFEINPDGTANTIIFDENNQIIEKGGIDKVGSSIYNPVYNVDFDTELQQFKNANPIDFIQTLGNNQKVGVKELTPRLKNTIDKYAEAKLTDKDVLINAYYNQTGKFKKDITDPKDIALAKKYIVDKFEGSYNKELNVDEAYQGANYRRQLAQDEKEEIKIGTADFGEYRQDDFLTTDKTIYRVGRKFVLPKEVTFPESKLTFKNLGGNNSDLNAGYVTSITKDKEGRFIVSGKAVKQKNIKYKGKDTPMFTVISEAEAGDEEAKSALSGYSLADIYGRFTRRVPQDEVSSLILKTPLKTLENLDRRINELNKNEVKNTKKVYAGIDPKTGKAIYK